MLENLHEALNQVSFELNALARLHSKDSGPHVSTEGTKKKASKKKASKKKASKKKASKKKRRRSKPTPKIDFGW